METKRGKNYNKACEKQTVKGERWGIREFYQMHNTNGREGGGGGSVTVLILLSKAHYVKRTSSDTPEMKSSEKNILSLK